MTKNWGDIWQNKVIGKTNDLSNILLKSGFTEVGITTQSWLKYIDGYVNNQFRFNVFMGGN